MGIHNRWGHEHLIKTVVGFKKLFVGANDDDYVFLCEFAWGWCSLTPAGQITTKV